MPENFDYQDLPGKQRIRPKQLRLALQLTALYEAGEKTKLEEDRLLFIKQWYRQPSKAA